jgi:hypothetical protein
MGVMMKPVPPHPSRIGENKGRRRGGGSARVVAMTGLDSAWASLVPRFTVA